MRLGESVTRYVARWASGPAYNACMCKGLESLARLRIASACQMKDFFGTADVMYRNIPLSFVSYLWSWSFWDSTVRSSSFLVARSIVMSYRSRYHQHMVGIITSRHLKSKQVLKPIKSNRSGWYSACILSILIQTSIQGARHNQHG